VVKVDDRWGVYVARCADGSLYTGVTTDLHARMRAHNDGRGARYTRARRPITPVFWEPGHSRGSALRLEHALKRLSRVRKLRLIGVT
jgi:putative endonuclease